LEKVRRFDGKAGVHYLREPVQLVDEGDVDDLLDSIENLPRNPALVIIDTFARCFSGYDENSVKDVGAFIAATDRIRRETGAAVMLLHHPDKKGKAERGSTSLRGAADTIIRVSQRGQTLTLECEKQKDAAPFEQISVTLRVVELDDGETSCVVLPANQALRSPQISEKGSRLLSALDSFVPKGATATSWKQGSGFPKATFYRLRKELLKLGLVEKQGAKYVSRSQSHRGLRVVSWDDVPDLVSRVSHP